LPGLQHAEAYSNHPIARLDPGSLIREALFREEVTAYEEMGGSE